MFVCPKHGCYHVLKERLSECLISFHQDARSEILDKGANNWALMAYKGNDLAVLEEDGLQELL